MSFQINLSDRSRVAARFIRRVHREIQNGFSHRAKSGLTQQSLAKKLDVNRATVNKRLLGRDNLTLRSIADLAWALDLEIDFRLTPKHGSSHSNVYTFTPPTAAPNPSSGVVGAADFPIERAFKVTAVHQNA
jgi:transcriptional regulator with XRE-family HTH domain